ncbi:MAG: Nramp family divalent metal transporter [Planctomycetaceae bacterium]
MSQAQDADQAPQIVAELPRTIRQWLCVFGPGAIVASLTIGTGELIFSTRGGALFGYRILFLFVLISVLKWGLVLASSRHMVLTGVHPYERMLQLPGPRGWMLIVLLLMTIVCMPIWVSFHCGVIGNLTSWVTGTRDLYHGGIDYLWGGLVLVILLAVSASGGYHVLERVQMVIVGTLVVCAGATLLIYRPDWMELLWGGFVPQPLAYPDWLASKYPEVARSSVYVETTRYVGVIGGAGFDYLAYTSFLREKRWGRAGAGPASMEELERIAADPGHEVRKWLKAPLIDSSIGFGLVVAFSAVFVASGAMFLGPNQKIPDEDNLLNLQAQFVTQIHPWLLPLYVSGAMFTMIGTLYGTIEVACSVADEIVRSVASPWTNSRSRKLKWSMIAWCALGALGILIWLFFRQAAELTDGPRSASSQASQSVGIASIDEPPLATDDGAPTRRQRPRLLLTILTPANLFTGVLACGLICMLNLWMDRKFLPVGLRLPIWLVLLNLLSGLVFLLLGLKGFWDHESRWYAVGSMLSILATGVVLAVILSRRRAAS